MKSLLTVVLLIMSMTAFAGDYRTAFRQLSLLESLTTFSGQCKINAKIHGTWDSRSCDKTWSMYKKLNFNIVKIAVKNGSITRLEFSTYINNLKTVVNDMNVIMDIIPSGEQ